MWALTTAPPPAQHRAHGQTPPTFTFSLRRERVALNVNHYNFSGGCLRDWLLSHLSQSDDRTQCILNALGH